MKKKRKIIKSSLKYLTFAIVLLAVLSLSPVGYNYGNPQVVTAQAATSAVRIKTQNHKESQSQYNDAIKAAKSDYKAARDKAWSALKDALAKATDKEQRIEARKQYRSDIKQAREKLTATLKEIKTTYQTNK